MANGRGSCPRSLGMSHANSDTRLMYALGYSAGVERSKLSPFKHCNDVVVPSQLYDYYECFDRCCNIMNVSTAIM